MIQASMGKAKLLGFLKDKVENTGKDGVPMQIVQRKSKDAELAQTVHVELQQVTIPGWMDEDEQPVTSAVVVEAAAPVTAKKDSKVDSHRKTFENAWWWAAAALAMAIVWRGE
jgi:hypothetical protein